METIDQFATRIKSKYPQYNDMDNKTLVNNIVNKYPTYKQDVDLSSSSSIQTESKPQQEVNPSKEHTSLLWKTLDVLNAGQYGMSNVLKKAIVDGDYNAVSNFINGLTLKDKTTTVDILKGMGWNPISKGGKITQSAVGLLGDMATDPMSWLGVGLVNRTLHGVEAGSDIAKIAKGVESIGAEATKVGDVIKSGTTESKLVKAARSKGVDTGSKAELTVQAPFGLSKEISTGISVEPIAKALGSAVYKARETSPLIDKAINTLTNISTKVRPSGIDPVVWERMLIASEKAANAEKSIQVDVASALDTMIKTQPSKEEQENILHLIENKALDGSSLSSDKYASTAQKTIEELSKKYESTGKPILSDTTKEQIPHVQLSQEPPFTGGKKLDYSSQTASSLHRGYVSAEGSPLLKSGEQLPESKYVINDNTGELYSEGKKIGTLDANELTKFNDPLSESQTLKRGIATIKDIEQATGEKKFITDLTKLTAIKGQRVAKAVKGTEYLKEVSNLGYDESKALREGKDISKMVSLGDTFPELKGKYFDPVVAEHIASTTHALTNDEILNSILKAYDAIQNKFKLTATLVNPAFHTRNAVSNFFQNAIAGVKPAEQADGMLIMTKLKLNPTSLTDKEKELISIAKDQGLLRGGGRIMGEVANRLEDIIPITKDGLNSIYDYVKYGVQQAGKYSGLTSYSKAATNLGDIVEEGAKLGHLKSKLDQGYSAFDAAMSVKKHLFDYGDLTKFEKNILKRVMPFYTFTKKNLPLQLETLIKNPSSQTKFLKLKNNIEVMTSDKDINAVLPDWFKNSSPIFIGKKDNKYRYMSLDGFLPFTELKKVLGNDQVKDMLSMISPVLKVPTEQALNYNFFFGQPITKQQGLAGWIPGKGYGEKEYMNWRIPGRLEYMARLFRPLSEIEKIAGDKYADKTLGEKIANFSIGLKYRDFDKSDLMKRFRNLNDQDANNIMIQINQLKKEIRQDPAHSNLKINDIKVLSKIYAKSKQQGRLKTAEVFKSMQQ